MRKIGNASIERVEEISGPGFAAARMFPRFDQQTFDAQKGWMKPDHVAGDSDKLVLWGWSPGPGRDPVSIPHDAFVAKFKQWVAAGAPCAP